jgi:tetratricopeptide (TPR) repeat protein
MFDVIACPQCGRKLRLPQESLGRLVVCPSCTAQFQPGEQRPVQTESIPWAEAAPPRESPAPPRVEGPRPERPLSTPKRPVKASAGSQWGIALLLIGVVLLGVGGVVAVVAVLTFTPPKKPRQLDWKPVAEKLVDDPDQFAPLVDPGREPTREEVIAGLTPVFNGLNAAIQRGNGNEIVEYFHIPRMTEQFVALYSRALYPITAQELLPGLKADFARFLARQAAETKWKKYEIFDVTILSRTDVSVIVSYTQEGNDTPFKVQWYATRRTGKWKLYDREYLSWGVGLSCDLAGLRKNRDPRLASIDRVMVKIRNTVDDLSTKNDVRAAERELEALEREMMSDHMAAARSQAWVMLRAQQNRNAEALALIEKARQQRHDMPSLDLQEARILNNLGRHAEALAKGEAYQKRAGPGLSCYDVGVALSHLNRFDEAAAQFRKTLDCTPKDEYVFLALIRCHIGHEDLSDIPERFAKLPDPHKQFETCAEDCVSRRVPRVLDVLVKAMKRVDPAAPRIPYFLALARAQEGNAADALAAYHKAFARMAEFKDQSEFRKRFLKLMAHNGKAAEAYAVVLIPSEEFRILADEARTAYRPAEELRALMAVHAKKNPNDPMMTLYEADLLARDERWAEADVKFTIAARTTWPAGVFESFRTSFVRTRYHVGKAREVLAAIGPRAETFRDLAMLCLSDNNLTELQALVEMQMIEDPSSFDVLEYDLRVRIRQKKIAEGVALFQRGMKEEVIGEKRNQLLSTFCWEMMNADRALEAYQAAPNASAAFRELGQLVERRNIDTLRKLVEAHRAKSPNDGWLLLYQTILHEKDKRWAEAADVAWTSIQKGPEELKTRLRWHWRQAKYQAGKWSQAYVQGGRTAEDYLQFANFLVNDRKFDALDAFVKERRADAPNDPEMEFHAYQVDIARKKVASAVKHFQTAYEKQTLTYRRPYYLSHFASDMVEQGQATVAYSAVKGTTLFESLARELVTKKDVKGLSNLLDTHRKQAPNDPKLRFYTGELFWLRGESVKADAEYTAALRKTSERDSWQVRNAFYRVRVKNGKAVATYREMQTQLGVMDSLVSECISQKDAGQMEQLLEVYRKEKPEDPSLPVWELDIRWLKKDWEGVVKYLDEHTERFKSSRTRWKTGRYRIRSLIQLKRTADAVKAAEALTKTSSGDKLLLILAHASTGDVPATIAAAEKLHPRPYMVQRYYTDEDLGPIVKSEPFAAFRTKFPEPKELPGDDDDDD